MISISEVKGQAPPHVFPILPLLVQDESQTDPLDSFQFASTSLLNRSYEFKSLYNHPIDPRDVHPSGPLVVVRVLRICDIVGHFHFFTHAHLTTIAASHHVYVPGRDHGSKAAARVLLSEHVCDPTCQQLAFVFRALKRDRPTARPSKKATASTNAHQALAQRHRQVSDNSATYRERHAVTLDATMLSQSPEFPFPPSRNDCDAYNIIKTWQDIMNPIRWLPKICAVCGQRKHTKDIRVLSPTSLHLTLLQNPHIPPDALPTTYNLQAYHHAILNPKGLHDRQALRAFDACSTCSRALVKNKRQPLDSLANFQYFGLDELPEDVKRALHSASMFDVMMVARSRATRITHLFTEKKGHTQHGKDPQLSQGYSSGNVAVLPQDSVHLRSVLPPGREEIAEAMCALFVGGDVKPTRENIKKLKPVLASKQNVKTMIDFLVTRNAWYKSSDVSFSPENFADLFDDTDGVADTAVPRAVELCHLPREMTMGDDDGMGGYTDGHNGAQTSTQRDLYMEAVGYTAGDRSPQNFRHMQASALAWCLDKKTFVKMQSNSHLLSESDPGMLTYLFPNLDPWGIGGFYEPRRKPEQQIPFERQVHNLLLQDESPFQTDPNFAYVCWNIMQKRDVKNNASFRTTPRMQQDLSNELRDIAPTLTELITKWESKPNHKPSNRQEKKAIHVLNKLRLVARELKGSSGYKQCRRNEIRALMKKYSTPALFVTLNPFDTTNPLLGALGNIPPDVWRSMDGFDRGRFVAQNPATAALFFDIMITAFLDIIVRYGKEQPGLFGHWYPALSHAAVA